MTDADKALWLSAMQDVAQMARRDIPNPPKVKLPSISVVKQFNPVLDLHGHAVASAHETVFGHIKEAWNNNVRTVVVITGRSGLIRDEFQHWLDCHPDVRKIETINGDGAFKLRLKK
jgi:DNA-nicking Smr family endonuclease